MPQSSHFTTVGEFSSPPKYLRIPRVRVLEPNERRCVHENAEAFRLDSGDRRHLGGSGPPEAAIGALLSAQQRQQPLQYQQARAAPEPTGLVTTGAALHVQRRGKLYRLPLHLHAGLHRGARGDITMDARWIGCGDASSRRAGPGWRGWIYNGLANVGAAKAILFSGRQ
eukprot:395967-Prorocentrum_minimum.AAC.2